MPNKGKEKLKKMIIFGGSRNSRCDFYTVTYTTNLCNGIKSWKPKVSPGMKAQTEIVNVTLFFLITVILVFSAFAWGSSAIGSKSEVANLLSSEQFMRNLDAKIKSVAKNGGVETLMIKPSANLRVIEGNVIEYNFPSKADMPKEWIYISGDEAAEVNINGSAAVLREKKKDDRIKIQLYYRNRTNENKFILLPFIYYEGSGSNVVKIENNGSEIIGNLVLTKVKLSVG